MESTARHRTWIAGLLLLALLVRSGVYIGLVDSTSNQDPDSYYAIAVNLVDQGTYSLGSDPTAFRPPIYPLLLAVGYFLGLSQVVWVGILHTTLGILTLFITFRLAKLCTNQTVAVLATLLLIFDPILLHQSSLTMTETTATFLGVLALWQWIRVQRDANLSNIICAGGALAMAGLCRPTFFVFAALALVCMLLRGRDNFYQRLRVTLLIGCCIIVVISPWVIRNQISLGKPIIATTHGGYTLLLGNNQLYYQHLDQPTSFYQATYFDTGVRRFNISENPGFDFWGPLAAQHPKVITRNEWERDHFSYQVAWYHIQQQPQQFARAALVRIGKLWSPLPQQLTPQESAITFILRFAVALWYLLLYAIVFWFSVKYGAKWVRNPLHVGILMILAFSLVHAFYWSDMRMRAPLMPILYLVAAMALAKPASADAKP
ncbi:MAG: glycosyltransferase family 39 protein [Planctomycetota bacterium]|nr:glycosyltransferase family 39 protein [Planctomycetota bacterium]